MYTNLIIFFCCSRVHGVSVNSEWRDVFRFSIVAPTPDRICLNTCNQNGVTTTAKGVTLIGQQYIRVFRISQRGFGLGRSRSSPGRNRRAWCCARCWRVKRTGICIGSPLPTRSGQRPPFPAARERLRIAFWLPATPLERWFRKGKLRAKVI